MRKRIFSGAFLLFLVFVSQQIYVFYISENSGLQAIYLIPKDAVYIIKTEKPLDDWNEISENDIWKHLQHNDYFKQLTKSLSTLDSVFKQKKGALNFIGNRDVLISAHTYKPEEYSFFYVIDLQKIARLNILKKNISKLVSKDFKVNKRKYHNHEIIEVTNIKNRETIYLSFIKNQLIISYIHTLIEASIDQHEEPIIGRDLNFIEIERKTGNGKLFELYFQYKYVPDFIECFSDNELPLITNISKNLIYSGFQFNLSNSSITAEGYTNVSSSASSYLKAIHKSKTGSSRDIIKVIPAKTSVYTSFSFNNFSDFYKNFETVLKENSINFNTYLDDLEKIENLLKINIKEHFISWIGDEIALISLKPSNKNDLAFVIKTNSVNKAQENLAFILKQIKKRTPLKINTVDYKEYQINYLAIKDFFKILFGDTFNKIDKPYYTTIDDYVIFSNNPTVLKYIINQYIEKKTLSESKYFEGFNNSFSSKSSIFTYINTPVLFDNIYSEANYKTQKKMKENRDFIICFSQLGFQLTTNKNIFKSKFSVKYESIADINNNPFYSHLPSNLKVISAKKTISNQEIDLKTIFVLPEIYPSDLNAKKYIVKHKNGKTKISLELKNGLKHGDYKEYYTNGKLRISGKYRKGKQVKLWKYYNEQGELITKKRM